MSKFKIKDWLLAIFIFVILFGGIGISMAQGWWKTTGGNGPGKIESGEYAGLSNPADIKGSHTFASIANSFGIPEEDLTSAFGVDEDLADSFKCKDLESIYAGLENVDIGTGSVRYFVSLYTGISITLTESSNLPGSAVDILLEKAKLSQEQIEQLQNIRVDLP